MPRASAATFGAFGPGFDFDGAFDANFGDMVIN
jgi:hypothetical protein